MSSTLKHVFFGLVALLLAGCGAEEPSLPGDGQWRLVNYWAIWCKPCREEIPALNVVDQRENIVVLGVNFDRKQDQELADQAAELGIAFELLTNDPGPMLGAPRPEGLPVTLVVSPDGDLVNTLVGPQTEESLLAAIGG
jgi:thiol-disulfide isomerase/thioredoxin